MSNKASRCLRLGRPVAFSHFPWSERRGADQACVTRVALPRRHASQARATKDEHDDRPLRPPYRFTAAIPPPAYRSPAAPPFRNTASIAPSSDALSVTAEAVAFFSI